MLALAPRAGWEESAQWPQIEAFPTIFTAMRSPSSVAPHMHLEALSSSTALPWCWFQEPDKKSRPNRPDRLNPPSSQHFPQCLQRYGLSPVCVKLWFKKNFSQPKRFPHSSRRQVFDFKMPLIFLFVEIKQKFFF